MPNLLSALSMYFCNTCGSSTLCLNLKYNSMCCLPVSASNKGSVCGHIPSLQFVKCASRFNFQMLSFPRCTSPSDNGMSRVIIDRAVVLPAPLGPEISRKFQRKFIENSSKLPTNPKHSFFLTPKVIPLTT
jgi:hypothetical protein